VYYWDGVRIVKGLRGRDGPGPTSCPHSIEIYLHELHSDQVPLNLLSAISLYALIGIFGSIYSFSFVEPTIVWDNPEIMMNLQH
jgi:hypothetical protein